ncbi:hypothetical protein BM535_22875, partial [Clostridioides difficile]
MSKRNTHTEIAKLFSLISQIGLMIVISILGCTFLGKFLDSKLNTTPVLTIIFLLLGV